jgi:hypothetical protein
MASWLVIHYKLQRTTCQDTGKTGIYDNNYREKRQKRASIAKKSVLGGDKLSNYREEGAKLRLKPKYPFHAICYSTIEKKIVDKLF